jgi:peroxiredoxin
MAGYRGIARASALVGLSVNESNLREENVMVLTPSTMLPLGTQAPDFVLPDTEGNVVSLQDFEDKRVLLVMFICNHCPYVKHVRKELVRIASDYKDRSVGIVAINSNDVDSYPDDAPDKMAEEKKTVGYTFPYLFDESQHVARAYFAACTPDFYVFDKGRRLYYRGQLDDSRPGNDIPLTGKDLRAALDAAIAGRSVPENQRPSMGCNIKWKAGNEPNYAGG